MKCEINKDYYCSGGYATEAYTPLSELTGRANWCYLKNKGFDEVNCSICGCYRHKYPTPEQFREDYGWDVPDDFPVWFIIPEDQNGNFPDWTLMVYADALQYEREEEEADFVPDMYIVCACTPFGKPDENWRPE